MRAAPGHAPCTLEVRTIERTLVCPGGLVPLFPLSQHTPATRTIGRLDIAVVKSRISQAFVLASSPSKLCFLSLLRLCQRQQACFWSLASGTQNTAVASKVVCNKRDPAATLPRNRNFVQPHWPPSVLAVIASPGSFLAGPRFQKRNSARLGYAVVKNMAFCPDDETPYN